ncbi:MAG: hypothetical protein AB7T49_17550 [Oligoflexales bacterium]
MKTMLPLSIFVLNMFLAPWALSQKIEVDELAMGACWVDNNGDTAKVASFNDGKAFVLSPETLTLNFYDQLGAELRNLGIDSYPESKIYLWLHCGGAGHRVTVKVDNSDMPLCIHTDGSMKILNIFSNFENGDGDSFCLGAQAKELIIGYSTEEDAEKIKSILREPNYADSIQSVETQEGFLLVTLADSFRFRESSVKSRLEVDPALKPHITYVSYNGIAVAVGQELKLFDAVYPGHETHALTKNHARTSRQKFSCSTLFPHGNFEIFFFKNMLTRQYKAEVKRVDNSTGILQLLATLKCDTDDQETDRMTYCSDDPKADRDRYYVTLYQRARLGSLLVEGETGPFNANLACEGHD